MTGTERFVFWRPDTERWVTAEDVGSGTPMHANVVPISADANGRVFLNDEWVDPATACPCPRDHGVPAYMNADYAIERAPGESLAQVAERDMANPAPSSDELSALLEDR